ncbi:MAG: hypothetical protein CBC35_07725 [Planctomycetes bacterium TMED75]|nr:ArsR family transcriptional regulator [Planctomycetaceae bacterium]OUU92244.1 MAG: hypothetical protein CBC35_07725 [Planctomycetes bacterium TMED75]
MTSENTDSVGSDWLALLSALSDHARVRLLRLLEEQELGVGELARSLAMPQSTVSRHLKLLYELGLLSKRTEGTASLYRMQISDAGLRSLWSNTTDRLGQEGEFRDDEIRLRQVLLERRSDSTSFFGRVGSDWQMIRRELFGFGFTEEALLGLLPGNWVVADLGCGSGDASERLAPVVDQVIAVDREPAMLDAARKRLSGFGNITFMEAGLDELPIESGLLDAAVLMLVLHHQEQPASIITEVQRTLKPGGRLVVVDMISHDRTDLVEAMGHIHLGFSEELLQAWAEQGGLTLRRFRRLHAPLSGRGPDLFAAMLSKSYD